MSSQGHFRAYKGPLDLKAPSEPLFNAAIQHPYKQQLLQSQQQPSEQHFAEGALPLQPASVPLNQSQVSGFKTLTAETADSAEWKDQAPAKQPTDALQTPTYMPDQSSPDHNIFVNTEQVTHGLIPASRPDSETQYAETSPYRTQSDRMLAHPDDSSAVVPRKQAVLLTDAEQHGVMMHQDIGPAFQGGISASQGGASASQGGTGAQQLALNGSETPPQPQEADEAMTVMDQEDLSDDFDLRKIHTVEELSK